MHARYWSIASPAVSVCSPAFMNVSVGSLHLADPDRFTR